MGGLRHPRTAKGNLGSQVTPRGPPWKGAKPPPRISKVGKLEVSVATLSFWQRSREKMESNEKQSESSLAVQHALSRLTVSASWHGKKRAKG